MTKPNELELFGLLFTLKPNTIRSHGFTHAPAVQGAQISGGDMPYPTEIIRILLYICLLAMALLAVMYLRRRRLSWLAYCGWGCLALLFPAIGPFVVILAHPGQQR